jgi:hypothetical protein
VQVNTSKSGKKPPELSLRLAVLRRYRLGPRSGAVLSVVCGAGVGLAINLATSGGHGWLILVLAVLAVSLWALVEFLRSSDPDRIALAARLRTQIECYDSAEWTNKAIDLVALNTDGERMQVHSALDNWIARRSSRLLVLSGAFGGGKTWTLRWLARELAERWLKGDRLTPAPILINLTRLSIHNVSTREQLFHLAWPEPMDENLVRSQSANVLLLLDSLDELMSLEGSDARARNVLNLIAGMESASTRFVIACRSEALESGTLLEDFTAQLTKTDSSDPTSWAVMEALHADRAHPEQVRILDVPDEQADAYLLHSKAGNAWQKVRNESAYRHLARVPFTIFLLTEALPLLTQGSSDTTLPVLYSKAVESWLLRAGLPSEELGGALIQLEDLARAMLFEHLVDQTRYDDTLLRKAGLLVRQSDGSYVFRHYSLGEYFLACAVFREMASYSSELLSRIDLVFANSINRFLIPMVKAEFQKAGGKAAAVAPKSVSIRDFREFMQRTGWRRTGFGKWLMMVTADGTLPWESADVKESSISLVNVIAAADESVDDSRITGISWYDAFQYCRWKGGRLPAAQEITGMILANKYDGREWSSSWYDETRALVTVVHMGIRESGHVQVSAQPIELEGINPDIRLHDLGFMVVGLG